MHQARHSSTDGLDLNVRWKSWPHEPGQAKADKLGAQTHLLIPTGVGAQQSWRVQPVCSLPKNIAGERQRPWGLR